jgi:hypothetical protein
MRSTVVHEYANQADASEQKHYRESVSPLPGIQHLRAYRHYHPATRVHVVEANGRVVWMTGKQYDIWCFVRASHHRRVKLRLAEIAKACHCSRATVSRFLTRLDLWRFVNIISRVGRLGGVWVMTRKAPSTTAEADANLSGAKHTLRSRRIARDRMWIEFRRHLEDTAQARTARNRKPTPKAPDTRPGGSTDATFMTMGI